MLLTGRFCFYSLMFSNVTATILQFQPVICNGISEFCTTGFLCQQMQLNLLANKKPAVTTLWLIFWTTNVFRVAVSSLL